MGQARNELLDAALSYRVGSEDRLTEVFATVLAGHPGFAAALLGDVGLPVGDRFDVLTQVVLVSGRRPDMVVRSWEGARLVSELWSEHKTGSGFSDLQREDYFQALTAEPSQGALLTITRDRGGTTSEHWEHRSWQAIGQLADDLGFAWGGAKWRIKALDAESPAKWRLLHELIWYLEREGFAVTQPLADDDMFVLSRLQRTVESVEALMQRAAVEFEPTIPDDAFGAHDDWSAWYVAVEAPQDAWLHRFDGFEAWCEVLLAVDGEWSPRSGAGAPAVGAGYSFDKALHSTLSANHELVGRLEEAGYELVLWEGVVRCWRTEPLSTFLNAGPRLDDQANALAAWLGKSITDLSALDPGPLVLPQRRQRRTRADFPEE